MFWKPFFLTIAILLSFSVYAHHHAEDNRNLILRGETARLQAENQTLAAQNKKLADDLILREREIALLSPMVKRYIASTQPAETPTTRPAVAQK